MGAMIRKTIRTFGISLLVLCFLAWMTTFVLAWDAGYVGPKSFDIRCNLGRIELIWMSHPWPRMQPGWGINFFSADAEIDGNFLVECQQSFGFSWKSEGHWTFFAIPFWAPFLVSALLLVVLWMLTRRKGERFFRDLVSPIPRLATDRNAPRRLKLLIAAMALLFLALLVSCWLRQRK